jgi:hypothetical protein
MHCIGSGLFSKAGGGKIWKYFKKCGTALENFAAQLPEL